jgi:parallel beta-helix repeat protein
LPTAAVWHYQSLTAVIQQALTAAETHGGGTVTLSAGTWTVDGTGKAADGCLQIGSNTTLTGAGTGVTLLKLADGAGAVTGILRTHSGATKSDGTYTTAQNIAVRGLTLDGNSAGRGAGDVDGFYCGPKPGTAQADTNITLDSVEIKNCSRYGFDPHEQTVGLTIRNSSAHHNGVDGFTIDFCSNVVLENNSAYANGRHGFNITTGTHHASMLGNTASNNAGNGITVQTGDNEVRGWTSTIAISGGTLTDNGRAGIEVRQASDVTIANVTIAGTGLEGIRLTGAHAVTLTGNTISNHGGNEAVRVVGLMQDFSDADTANDCWIGSTGIIIDGVAQSPILPPPGTVTWPWSITTGADVIVGSSGRDIIAADSGNDTVNGGAGNDVLYGNDGRDVLNGGLGDDRLVGGAGADRLVYTSGFDVLDGGAGKDFADFFGLRTGVTVRLSTGPVDAWLGTTAIADLISIEDVRGTSYADTLTGDAGANRLFGCSGVDTLNGGAGNDVLVGGRLSDVLTGGLGLDLFRVAILDGVDTVTDFTLGQDRLGFVAPLLADGTRPLFSLDNLAISNIVNPDGAVSATLVVCHGVGFVLQGVDGSALTAASFAFL